MLNDSASVTTYVISGQRITLSAFQNGASAAAGQLSNKKLIEGLHRPLTLMHVNQLAAEVSGYDNEPLLYATQRLSLIGITSAGHLKRHRASSARALCRVVISYPVKTVLGFPVS